MGCGQVDLILGTTYKERECGPLFQVSKATKFCVLGLPKPVCIEIFRNVVVVFSKIQFIFIKPSKS